MSRDGGSAPEEEPSTGAVRVGHVIAGKYRIDALLGEGGMGAVYAAQNLMINSRVAVKLLHPEFQSRRETVQRFLQEARSASKMIDHPNIVHVFDLGEDADGTLFIVQEFLDGMDLERRLKQPEKLSLVEVLSIVLPILDALESAHERGIIHRDIKPANIFLTERRGVMVPKLIDFGISKVLGDDGTLKTRTGATLGTPYYMSPEQARGEVKLDVRTDVWSIAAVLFEMLAGRGPFEAANYNQLIVKLVTERPPRVETFAPDTPPDLADVLHAALEPDLGKRLPTVRAFHEALRDCPSLRVSNPDAVRPFRAPTAPKPPPAAVGHLDTLPSTPPTPDLAAPAPPAARPAASTLALVAGVPLLGLLAFFGLRAVTPSAPSARAPQVATPRPAPPQPAPPAPAVIVAPEAPPVALPEAAPPIAANVLDATLAHRPRVARPVVTVAPRVMHDAGAPHVAPTPEPPTAPTAATPGDGLRPALRYPRPPPDAS